MKTVLIVDDIEEYVETLAIYLEDDFRVLTSLNFKAAEKVIADESLDLAIIDIRLDEDDPDNKEGLAVLRLLKDKSPNIPAIVMSAYQEFDYAVEALNAGADYFMRKPLDPAELEKVIKKLG